MADTSNVCQYWNTNEPPICEFWVDGACSKDDSYLSPAGPGGELDFPNGAASRYPNCNSLGTALDCDSYHSESTEDISICILPDPARHVCNRATGEKWSIDQINGYNDGQCDGNGTYTTCSGYSPYHLAFSKLRPTISGADESGFSAIGSDDLPYRLPFYYLVANSRAKISRCHWWEGNAAEFTIDSNGAVSVPEFKCSNTSDSATQEFSENRFDNDSGTVIGMCNGAKPECPGYTGVCWKYCKDTYMKQGDKIRAEQILELRYYMRGEKWTKPEFEALFDDHSNIWAWAGPDGMEYTYSESGYVDTWLIDAISNKIEDFSSFNIVKSMEPLSEGTESVDDNVPNYPTLVRYLYPPALKPVIRNQFPTEGGEGSAPPNVEYADDGSVIEQTNYFEVTRAEHEDIVIWGDSFYYNPTIYAFNLADPEVAALFPNELFEYKSMFDLRTSLYSSNDAGASSDVYNEVYSQIDAAISAITTKRPDKAFVSEIGSNDFLKNSAFYIPVKTFFGNNNIVVFCDGPGYWEYDRVEFVKILSNGVLTQTEFTVEGETGGTVSYLPNFESSFMCDLNGNDTIKFEFKSFTSNTTGQETATPYYVYNDSVVEPIPSDPYNPIFEYDVGYELRKVPITITDNVDVIFFGNAGHCMLRIKDPENFYNVHGSAVMDDIILYAQDLAIPMDVMEIGTDRLEVDQIFLRPSNITGPVGFKRPCVNDIGFDIGECSVYKKVSFDDTKTHSDFQGVVVRESWLPAEPDDDSDEADLVNYRDVLQVVDSFSSSIQVSSLGKDSLVLSMVYRGAVSGLVKGISKTKLMVWVRQPYCRDVEIYYKWASAFDHKQLTPLRVCAPEQIGENDLGTFELYFTPWCGDHSLNAMTLIGPMWHPYHDCASYDVYRNLGPGAEIFENSVMEVFEEVDDDGQFLHGSWDLRMMGPHDNYSNRGEGFASIWACSCDFTYYNYERLGDNHFKGWGKIRCGIPQYELLELTQYGGIGPQFGNPYRDFLRSFRSFDSEYYYYINIDSGGSLVRLKKWMPIPYQFGFADITESPTKFPFKLYCSDDYSGGSIGDNSIFVHPMSIFMVEGTIEGVYNGENLSENRVRYEEVLNGHSNIGWLNYPKPRDEYYATTQLVPVKSWYTYVTPSYEASLGLFTQFVWQEKWTPLERGYIDNDLSIDATDVDTYSCCSNWDKDINNISVKFPYTTLMDGSIVGAHRFGTPEYPDYQYSANLDEHRLVCEEGTHTLKFYPPLWEDNNNYFWVKLDSGCWRAFDISGNFDPFGSASKNNPDSNTNHSVYAAWENDVECLSDPTLWQMEFISLSEAKEHAEQNDQYIDVYDNDTGDRVRYFYQTGINFTLENPIEYLPVKTILVGTAIYDIYYNSGSPILLGGTPDVGEAYPAVYNIEARYDGNLVNSGEIEFIVHPPDNLEDAGAISKLCIVFRYGYSEGEFIYYNLPKVSISVDGVGVYSCDDINVCEFDSTPQEVGCEYEWFTASEDIYNAIQTSEEVSVKVTLGFTPTSEDLSESGITQTQYNGRENIFCVKDIYLFSSRFCEASENFNTYERMYRYSVGATGDAGFPPYEKDGGNLLTVPSFEGSTVYQHDYANGIKGAPGTTFSELKNDWKTGLTYCMDKHRGRIMGAVFEDEYALTGNDVHDWETYQKQIYDNLIDAGESEFTMVASLPPGFEDVMVDSDSDFSFGSACVFRNTLLPYLTQVAPQDNYNACGHKWVHELVPAMNIANLIGLRCVDFVWRAVIVQYTIVNPCTGGTWFENVFEVYVNRVWNYILEIFAAAEVGFNTYAPNIRPGMGRYWASVEGSLQTPPNVNYSF